MKAFLLVGLGWVIGVIQVVTLAVLAAGKRHDEAVSQEHGGAA